MSATSDRLPFDEADVDADAEARQRAVDPQHHVVLEASAGTGKTHVLVDRYLNLLRHGVDPANILAITFTRKAAAEMRSRILDALQERAGRTVGDQALWAAVRDRAADIAISTIDAFCLSLLHEFPLEADLEPGFEMADETQLPRLIEEALDRALDVGRGLAGSDEHVRLLLAELREPRIREGLAAMLEHRLVVEGALERALRMSPHDLTAADACDQALARLRDLFAVFRGGVEAFLDSGPCGILAIACWPQTCGAWSRGACRPRRVPHAPCSSGSRRTSSPPTASRGSGSAATRRRTANAPAAWKHHLSDVQRLAPSVAEVMWAFRRDLNAVLSRGVQRMYRIALDQYRRALDAYGVLDFSEALSRALLLLVADGGVRAQPVPAGGALPPRAGGRVPGHEPGAVGARGPAGAVVGRGQRRRRRRAAGADDLPRRRPQAVDLRLPRRRRRRDEGCRRLRRSPSAQRERRAGRSRKASGPFRICSPSSTTCSARSSSIDSRRDAFEFTADDRFPLGEFDEAAGAGARHDRRADGDGLRRARSPRRSTA